MVRGPNSNLLALAHFPGSHQAPISAIELPKSVHLSIFVGPGMFDITVIVINGFLA
ncbi:MAG: hypothetical protein WCO95_06305 [Actinomycetes bacterium]